VSTLNLAAQDGTVFWTLVAAMHISMNDLDSIADELVVIICRALKDVPPSACGGVQGGACADCGKCAALCPERTRHIVEAGAGRISATDVHGAEVPRDIANYIDHTLLKPDATPTEIERLCREAREYGFAAVCVNPPFAKMCADLLRGTDVAVAVVVGFPLGAHTTATKVFETEQAIVEGATEIDMVINIGALKAKRDDYVREDIRNVVEAAHRLTAIVKVIIEAALLSDEEKIRACRLAKEAGADFVKTSTGFGPGGATVHDVELMRRTVGPSLGVKAAGGVKTLAQAQEMIAAGATRIGASAGVKIVQEARAQNVRGAGMVDAKAKY
jgi:deoxyribose-phosphate aldolase